MSDCIRHLNLCIREVPLTMCARHGWGGGDGSSRRGGSTAPLYDIYRKAQPNRAQPEGIVVADGVVARIRVEIHPTREPDRILRQEKPDCQSVVISLPDKSLPERVSPLSGGRVGHTSTQKFPDALVEAACERKGDGIAVALPPREWPPMAWQSQTHVFQTDQLGPVPTRLTCMSSPDRRTVMTVFPVTMSQGDCD